MAVDTQMAKAHSATDAVIVVVLGQNKMLFLSTLMNIPKRNKAQFVRYISFVLRAEKCIKYMYLYFITFFWGGDKTLADETLIHARTSSSFRQSKQLKENALCRFLSSYR